MDEQDASARRRALSGRMAQLAGEIEEMDLTGKEAKRWVLSLFMAIVGGLLKAPPPELATLLHEVASHYAGDTTEGERKDSTITWET